MERFFGFYPPREANVEIQILDPIGSGWDTFREVRLIFQDGERRNAGFCLDPMNRNIHWWEEIGMAIVEDFATERILRMVEDVLEQGRVEEKFEPMSRDLTE